MKKIINVANRLPVTISGDEITASSGGLVAALEGVKGIYDLKWVGWPGTSIKKDSEQQKIESRLNDKFGYHPVFMNRREVSDFYDGFSNSSLWPLLHYMTNYVRYESQWWQQYELINNRFAQKVLDIADEDDIVWIHDYHLMLLPSILRNKASNLKIGFFLHTPFPSYEIFRCHPKREELLNGLIGADLIGFHTFGYMRHFRSSVMRVLGLETDMNGIKTDSGFCSLGTFPIGINTRAFREELASESCAEKKEYFVKHFAGKRIILSVERLDYTKGLPGRIMAIDKFLEKSPDRNNVCFVFVAVPSRDEVAEYQELRDNVESLVGRINGKYSTLDNVPIRFIHHSIDFTELCALYSIADIAMVTPLIDGMNLVAKEYAMCKSSGDGALILSEFAGAAQELFKSIKVNPYDIDSMARAIDEALNMEPTDKKRRMTGMYERVSEYDAVFWAKSFVNNLVKTPQRAFIPQQQTNSDKYIESRFKSASKIGLFLDYDGSLREFQDSPEKAKPTADLVELLRKIGEAENIDGYIISGRKADNLSEWFDHLGVALVAEHGFEAKLPGGEWMPLVDIYDHSWKIQVRNILEQYSGTVPGSFIEEKISAIVWHYRRADPEFGKWRANQLVSNLAEMKANLPVEVHEGAKIVEVSSMQINKGNAVQKLIDGKDYDLVVCVGDDYTDETMFRIKDKRLLSVKIGKGETEADVSLGSPSQFRFLLRRILE